MRPDEFDAELARRLERFTAPAPDPADTAALVEPLAATLGWLTAQVHLFHPAFWAASALLLLVGVLVLSAAAGTGLPQALAVVAPLPAALGVAYAFRTATGSSAELELACPISPVQVALGRTVLVLGYNLALGIPAAWAPRWLAPATAPALGALLLGWLAPLLLTGLTLCLTALVGVYPGVGGGLAVWALQVLWLARPDWADPMRRLALCRSPADEGWLATQLGARRLALNGPEGR